MLQVYLRNALTIALAAFLAGAAVYQVGKDWNASLLASGVSAATSLYHLLTTAPKDSTQNPISAASVLATREQDKA